ncbi:YlbF family regulator [Pueribacillus theae]|nr:YlbF family regulator [Pueribacillus theae]
MSIDTEKSAILEMTEKLCETILDQPEYKEINRKINTFAYNEQAKMLYQSLYDHQMRLHQKQQQGFPVTDEESQAFQKEYEKALENDTIKEFIEAQQQIEEIEQTVNMYVSTTIKLGRLPKPEDFQSGSCGCGGGACGCGGH